jgi:polysaccharide biosynthesis/export protein
MVYNGLVAILASLVMMFGPETIRAGESKVYVVEPPDVLRLEVTGLPKKAQQVKGEFMVRPDGTISLGVYGCVTVTGLTLDQTRAAITKVLSTQAKKKDKLQVDAQVSAYNSKFYYLICTEKNGEQVYRFPLGGGETVVSAVLQIDGLSAVAAKGRVWVGNSNGKVRTVEWQAITQEGRLTTNYKLEAGDRVYIVNSPAK